MGSRDVMRTKLDATNESVSVSGRAEGLWEHNS